MNDDEVIFGGDLNTELDNNDILFRHLDSFACDLQLTCMDDKCVTAAIVVGRACAALCAPVALMCCTQTTELIIMHQTVVQPF